MSYWTHSKFTGVIQNGWMEGEGEFVFPSGVVYKGHFHKGEFHGEGELIFPNGGRYVAQWERGYATTGKYVFKDNLLFRDKDWAYMTENDRRFYIEVVKGLRPGGATYKTNEDPPAPLPIGTYDTGNGYYSTETKGIHDYKTGDLIEEPSVEEAEWIVNNCRIGEFETIDKDRELEEWWENNKISFPETVSH